MNYSKEILQPLSSKELIEIEGGIDPVVTTLAVGTLLIAWGNMCISAFNSGYQAGKDAAKN